jgi:hypothetical protein
MITFNQWNHHAIMDHNEFKKQKTKSFFNFILQSSIFKLKLQLIDSNSSINNLQTSIHRSNSSINRFNQSINESMKFIDSMKSTKIHKTHRNPKINEIPKTPKNPQKPPNPPDPQIRPKPDHLDHTANPQTCTNVCRTDTSNENPEFKDSKHPMKTINPFKQSIQSINQ